MNILDENIIESQCQLLRKWRIRFRQIGVDVGTSGIQDQEIVRLLHGTGGATFFTRDDDFSEQRLCHAAYCIVVLDVGQTRLPALLAESCDTSSFVPRPNVWEGC